jgi:hypothetical protein
MKKTGLIITIIVCLVVFFVSLTAGAILTAKTIGWANLQDRVKLRDRLEKIFDNINLPGFLHGDRQAFTIDDSKTASLDGIKEIRISGVAENIRVDTGGSVIEAHIRGAYHSWGQQLVWIVEKSGDTLLVHANYPPFGLLDNNLVIEMLIPAEFTGLVKIGTVSGNCVLTGGVTRSWSSLQYSGVSGMLQIGHADIPQIKVGSVSGSLELLGCTGQVTGETVSGKIHIAWDNFQGATLKTVSGQVDLGLPADSGAVINFTTVSGGFNNMGLPLTITSQQKRHLAAVLNGGDHALTVNTVSGGLAISLP